MLVNQIVDRKFKDSRIIRKWKICTIKITQKFPNQYYSEIQPFFSPRYGFRGNPQLWLVAKPKVGEREVTVSHITDWIEKKLSHEFQVLQDDPAIRGTDKVCIC